MTLSSLPEITNHLVQTHLDAGRVMRLTITTASMWPTLAPGDRVTVRGIGAQDVKLGDVVVLNRQEVRLVHRVIACRNEHGTAVLITKGDNCVWADEPLPESQLLGLVVAIERGARAVNLQSARARWANRAVAHLSRSEWRAQRLPRRLLWRAWRKWLRLSIRVSAQIAFWMAC
ncbi:MAG: signal peptidase I [Chloroflexi bacterium]|nr:signal peptidase I [Chloroflexota bacterium]